MDNISGGSDQKREGYWIWSDGGAWNEEHWESGQPDGFQGENCLVWKDWNLSGLLSTYLVSLVIKFSDFGRFLEDKTFLQYMYIDSCRYRGCYDACVTVHFRGERIIRYLNIIRILEAEY